MVRLKDRLDTNDGDQMARHWSALKCQRNIESLYNRVRALCRQDNGSVGEGELARNEMLHLMVKKAERMLVQIEEAA